MGGDNRLHECEHAHQPFFLFVNTGFTQAYACLRFRLFHLCFTSVLVDVYVGGV